MDEIFFRTSQRLETFQIQLSLAAQQSKALFLQYSESGRDLVIHTWNSPKTIQVREALKELVEVILTIAENVHIKSVMFIHSPRRFFHEFKGVITGEWTKQNLYCLCCGLVIGALIGFSFGISFSRSPYSYPHVKAIICNSYNGIDTITCTDDAYMPSVKQSDDVLIQVKAASIQIIDTEICKGYGRNIRKHTTKYFQNFHGEFPIILGRDCAGIVTEIGPKVTRFEIGDEVWVTVPFWHPGTIAEMIAVREHYVGKKPKDVGFVGATSIPYSGSMACHALKKAGLNEENSNGKRIFIQGSCTPVGCILIQILKLWGAIISTTTTTRTLPVSKALGSSDNITLLYEESIKLNSPPNGVIGESNHDDVPNKTNQKTAYLLKELEVRNTFDGIFITEDVGITMKEYRNYVKRNGFVVCAMEEKLRSDNFGFLLGTFFSMWLRSKCFMQNIFTGHLSNLGGPFLHYSTLDNLSRFIEMKQLQTVVDHIYPPEEIEIAIMHKLSSDAIGNTIIKFK